MSRNLCDTGNMLLIVVGQARNSLMFSPDADESPYHVDPRKLPEVKGPPKTIVHSGTRIDAQEHSNSHTPSASEPSSPTRSRINAAISGTPCMSTACP